jgi:predicted XRE-type DNA-binding protein
MNLNNLEVRKAIEKKRLKYYEVAAACGVTQHTFSHWLQNELTDNKKKAVLKTIREIKV